jgi:hypothetical protein
VCADMVVRQAGLGFVAAATAGGAAAASKAASACVFTVLLLNWISVMFQRSQCSHICQLCCGPAGSIVIDTTSQGMDHAAFSMGGRAVSYLSTTPTAAGSSQHLITPICLPLSCFSP